uniref:C3H1-type domain-containing protein n=1 Tax=Chromera velia CCMP2878 TaxID=1169474 RepID=A0A0G4I6L4_9ALVE|eukprot:Cvel_1909.t1-p1 / transcript=Cvel_1909.t1 / gene=Cvel_1909 / organism=Chromera_velia_CCMP2878 / gene_product=Zinc finger CCCH domain-containing protein 20, putative / transcript_product=Zinc finger CCCH domain-containing protein 20, putative / location=Cvel_scaffold71:122799-127144(-) / protein_length=1023 / sequence_SO=supercontig / SO=protein_coding / is_pseudo=false
MRVHNHCKRGRLCMYSHSKEEQMFHPTVYKTQPCRDFPNCPRYYCPFAHGPEELRTEIHFQTLQGPETSDLPPALQKEKTFYERQSIGPLPTTGSAGGQGQGSGSGGVRMPPSSVSSAPMAAGHSPSPPHMGEPDPRGDWGRRPGPPLPHSANSETFISAFTDCSVSFPSPGTLPHPPQVHQRPPPRHTQVHSQRSSACAPSSCSASRYSPTIAPSASPSPSPNLPEAHPLPAREAGGRRSPVLSSRLLPGSPRSLSRGLRNGDRESAETRHSASARPHLSAGPSSSPHGMQGGDAGCPPFSWDGELSLRTPTGAPDGRRPDVQLPSKGRSQKQQQQQQQTSHPQLLQRQTPWQQNQKRNGAGGSQWGSRDAPSRGGRRERRGAAWGNGGREMGTLGGRRTEREEKVSGETAGCLGGANGDGARSHVPFSADPMNGGRVTLPHQEKMQLYHPSSERGSRNPQGSGTAIPSVPPGGRFTGQQGGGGLPEWMDESPSNAQFSFSGQPNGNPILGPSMGERQERERESARGSPLEKKEGMMRPQQQQQQAHSVETKNGKRESQQTSMSTHASSSSSSSSSSAAQQQRMSAHSWAPSARHPSYASPMLPPGLSLVVQAENQSERAAALTQGGEGKESVRERRTDGSDSHNEPCPPPPPPLPPPSAQHPPLPYDHNASVSLSLTYLASLLQNEKMLASLPEEVRAEVRLHMERLQMSMKANSGEQKQFGQTAQDAGLHPQQQQAPFLSPSKLSPHGQRSGVPAALDQAQTFRSDQQVHPASQQPQQAQGSVSCAAYGDLGLAGISDMVVASSPPMFGGFGAGGSGEEGGQTPVGTSGRDGGCPLSSSAGGHDRLPRTSSSVHGSERKGGVGWLGISSFPFPDGLLSPLQQPTRGAVPSPNSCGGPTPTPDRPPGGALAIPAWFGEGMGGQWTAEEVIRVQQQQQQGGGGEMNLKGHRSGLGGGGVGVPSHTAAAGQPVKEAGRGYGERGVGPPAAAEERGELNGLGEDVVEDSSSDDSDSDSEGEEEE